MFTIFTHVMTALGRDKKGATAIEYGLIAALIAIAIIAGATALGTSLNDIFGAVADNLDAHKPS
jgi:pilus assembly protein Flp/PilA